MPATRKSVSPANPSSSTRFPGSLLPIAAAIMALTCVRGQAATVTYVSPNYGYWDVAGFWSALPGNGDTILTGNARTEFRQGTLDIASMTGTGQLTMSGGTLRFAGASSMGTVDLSGTGAVLSGAGTLTVGAIHMNSGTLGESGHGGGVINSTGKADFNPISGLSLNINTTLNLNGGATWTASSGGTIGINSGNYGGQINIAAGTTFSDSGTLTSSQYRYLGATSQGLVDNSGTYTRSGLGTTYVQAQLTNENSGVVNVNGGALVLGGTYGGYGGGTWNVASGATLQFGSGTSSSIYGAINNNGTFVSAGNTALSLNSYSGNGAINITGGTFSTTSGSATMGPGSVSILGGSTRLNSTLNTSTLSVSGGGVLSGSGTVTTNVLNFYTATMGESGYTGGATTVTGFAGFDGTSTQAITAGRALNLNGSATWYASTAGAINIGGVGSKVAVGSGATFADQGTTGAGQTRRLGGSGSTGAFVNQGTYTRTGLGTTQVDAVFTNSGTVSVSGGAMDFNNGGTSTGALTVASGGAMSFGGGSYAVNGGTLINAGNLTVSSGTLAVGSSVNFSGAGTVSVTGGQLNSVASANLIGGTMNVSGGAVTLARGGTIGNLSISGGSVSSQYAGDSTGLTVGTLSFTGGAMTESTATGLRTTVTGAATFGAGTETLSNGHQLSLNGATTWAAGNGSTIAIVGGNSGSQAQLGVGSGATFADLGGGTRILGGDGFSYVTNAGTYTRTGSGTTTATNSFTNAGTLNINGGTMAFAAGYDTFVGHGSTGTINIASGATMQDDTKFTVSAGAVNNQGQLKVNAGTTTLAAGVAYSGAGAINVTGGALVSGITSAVSTGGIALTGGTASFVGAVNASSLALAGGTLTAVGNVTVATDYTNSGFGSGNGYNKRAGVSGIGAINGVNVSEAITGANITNGTTGNATLTIGNVRVNAANSYAYQVANTGTGSTLRGAIQNTGAGLGVTDARLSGSGVTAANFGPLAAGTNSGDLAVGFTASTAGAIVLAGVNTIHVANDFGNVAEQNLAIVAGTGAAAYNVAAGSASASLGNVRVGAALSGGITVTNTAASGAYSEDLNASVGATSGSASASGSLSGLKAGTSNGNTLMASLDSSSAGLKTGSVTIGYTTAGKVAGVSNGLGTLVVGSQVVAVSAGVYNYAVGSITPTPLSVANQRVGGNNSAAVVISNTAASGAYTEALNGSFIDTGTGVVTNGGSVTNLAAGTSNGTAMSVGVGTATAGLKSGVVGVAFQSDGTGSNGHSGLAAVDITNQYVAVSGSVFNAAKGSISTSPIVIANQRVQGANASTVTVSNTAASGAYSEALNASIGVVTGGATASGSFTNLIAGGNNASAIGVGVDTTTAGFKSGMVTIGYVSDGTVSNGNSGLAAIDAGSQTVAVSGRVYDVAVGAMTTSPIVLANQRTGGINTGALSISNTASSGAYTEALNATITGASGGLLASGSVSNLVAGGIASNAINVGVNTMTAGLKSGTVTVGYQSDGTGPNGNSGLAAIAAGSQTVAVSGKVYDVAVGSMSSTPIVLASQRIGGAGTSALLVSNTAATGGYSEALNASVTGTSAGLVSGGSVSNLAAGTSNGTAINVGVNTMTAGLKSGTVTVAYQSDGTGPNGNSGLAAIATGTQTVDVSGAVYRMAGPVMTTGPITAVARVGDVVQSSFIGITNSSPDAYTEGLTVTRNATAAGFIASGGITNLAAGASSSAIGVKLDTSTAGTFTGNQALGYVSTGAGTTGAADLAIGNGNVTLNGKVYAAAVASVSAAAAAVDFGIVHVGDVASRSVSVMNAAVGALTDVLTGSARGAGASFSASGNLGSGVAAGSSSSAFTVGMNTSTSGAHAGTAAFSVASHDADLSDAALADLAVSLTGTVDNYATDAFGLAGGAGTLSHVGSIYYLDYGSVTQGSGMQVTSLLAGNSASGLADLLDGTFDLTDADDFGESGFASFTNLAAGQVGEPLKVSFDARALGDFTDTITLHGLGHNASGYSAALDDLRLVVRGSVIAGADVPGPASSDVPEPDAWMLIGLGIPLILVRRACRSGSTIRLRRALPR